MAIADVNAVNAPGRGGTVLSFTLDLPMGFRLGLIRDPFNAGPFLSVIATGVYPPATAAVTFNGRFVGHLDPAAMNAQGQNQTILPVPEGLVAAGINSLMIDTTGAPGVILDNVRLVLGGVNTIPRPGWGDADGDVDLGDGSASVTCLSGPGGGLSAPECESLDIDEDGDVDLADYRLFQTVHTGAL